jgi:cytochrome P450
MSQRPELQIRLRSELASVPLPSSTRDTSPLSQEELSALDRLPLLDAIVRETLRVHPPVPGTMRVAVRDDVIPVSKPYIDKYGKLHDTIRISKGEHVIIPMLVMNRLKEIWGEDAHEWK